MRENYYEEHKFEDLKLENELIENCEFIDCMFVSCKIDLCKLVNCTFSGCIFEKCSITNLTSEYSYMNSSQFIACNLIGIDWLDLQPNGRFINLISKLENCQLKYNTFTEFNFKKFDFSGTDIIRSMFAKCELVESNFKGCNLNETEFFQCDIRRADFRDASGYRIDILTNKMKASRFSFPEAVHLLDSLDLEIE